ncbi:ATP synthase, Delta/Epsilon chain, beta-sandwich domain protein [Paraburkholderia fungorum]|jgi:F-type H+-transporting ATPase subunit epsilon|uniref:ATP synthase epsilon chain n=1 Tax=Paraburkholderia fungorum TaxID=134537 RepID=A0AAP5QGH8_9BURK|nr:F0F1 ATP synthase subunit epsilon [Paraburkholderia fungorum]AJZ56552.1 ATP synthase, Delta/Epsilon chain, beta-sandwich domain protein [Paraburkholderia fungorum]MDT8843278.1 F0F1 ATP synthase subunit epsilon [Paraburkholderia fungorum]
MTAPLHLTIATPASVLFDSQEVVALRAEDESGSFGILPGHADFLTVLTPCVLRWHGADGVPHFCAVEEGVLSVSGGHSVSIACRDGVLGDTLDTLETQVQTARAKRLDILRQARVEQTRLHAQAVRQLLRYLRPGASPAAAGPDGQADDHTDGGNAS